MTGPNGAQRCNIRMNKSGSAFACFRRASSFVLSFQSNHQNVSRHPSFKRNRQAHIGFITRAYWLEPLPTRILSELSRARQGNQLTLGEVFMDDGYDGSQESGTPLPTKHAKLSDQVKCRCDSYRLESGVRRSNVQHTTSRMTTAQCSDHFSQATAHSEKPSQPVNRFRKSVIARGLPKGTLANLHRSPHWSPEWAAYCVAIGRRLGYLECCIQSFAAGRVGFMISPFDRMALDEKFPKGLDMVPCQKCIGKLLAGEIKPEDLRGGRTRRINGPELRKLCEEASKEAKQWLKLDK